MATAQSMAWALEIPLVPVCSLDALAMNAEMSELTVAAALDARRGEVYWALYRMRGVGMEPQRLTEPVVSSPEDLAVHLADRAEDTICVGSGFDRHAELFEASPWTQLVGHDALFPSAASVVTLGGHRVMADDTVTAMQLQPMYLRAPDAEINWKTREGSR
jgi:tRNA threonylcarbamoyladenosine biosynthesis protein TsaB